MTALGRAETTKTCSRCKRAQPLTSFCPDRRSRSGVMPECRACRASRRRMTAFPDGVFATNLLVEQAPDPAPAIRLRAELERQRDAGRPWRAAWPFAVGQAVRNLSPGEAASWRRAFSETRGAWQGSYCGITWPGVSRPMFLPDEK